jgi:hypothetical protein
MVWVVVAVGVPKGLFAHAQKARSRSAQVLVTTCR